MMQTDLLMDKYLSVGVISIFSYYVMDCPLSYIVKMLEFMKNYRNLKSLLRKK